jgi:hypothetical protein
MWVFLKNNSFLAISSLPCLGESIAVIVWMGMFAVCILQLVVAGALCGGTYEVCLRIPVVEQILHYFSSYILYVIMF